MIGVGVSIGSVAALSRSPAWFRRPSELVGGVVPGFHLDARNGRYAIGGAASTLAALVTVTNASTVRTAVNAARGFDTVAANVPRVDWSSGAAEVLLEGAATKWGPYSEAIGGTNYGFNGLTAGAFSLGPDGSAGMREMQETTSGVIAHNWWSATITSAAAAGEFWAHQIIVRRGSGTRNIKFRNIGTAFTSGYPEVCVDLATGAVLSSVACGRVAVVPLVIPGVGACWRIEMTATTTQSGTIVASCYFLSGSTSGTDWYSGDGTSSIHFGYVNVEKVSRADAPPTSYVKVPGTASVTRTADLCALSASAAAVLQGSGGMIAWRGTVPLLVSGQQLVGLGGGYGLLSGDAGTGIVAGGWSGGDLTIGSGILPGTVAAAYGWGASGRIGSDHGAAAVSDAHALDRARTSVFLGPSSGLAAGQILRIAQLVGWSLPDMPAVADVRAQARIAA